MSPSKTSAALHLSLLLARTAQSAEVFYDWTLAPVLQNDLSPDCSNIKEARRYMFLAEKQMPGPLIEAVEGDTIRLRITNMNEAVSVSIHAHGIHQIGTPYDDGPTGITQCALGPFQSQEYVYTAYPAGTHYWHAHHSLNLEDGLTGPIVVRPAEDNSMETLFEYDEERIIFLQDWFMETGTQQLFGLNSFPFTWIGNPRSILVNGKGIATACEAGSDTASDETLCQTQVCQDLLSLLETITVESGKTYRLRIINSAQLVMMNLAIAGHTMTVVQIEGTVIDPVNVETLDIAPGQRYDVLITADQPAASYWMEMSVRERNIPSLFGRAIFQYAGANATIPDVAPVHPLWNDAAHGVAQDDSFFTKNVEAHPTEAPALTAAPEDVTRYVLVGTQNLLLDEETGAPTLLRWAVNNISNTPHLTPSGLEPLIGLAVKSAKNLGWPLSDGLEGTTDMPLTPPTVWNYTEKVDAAVGGPGAALGKQAETLVQLEKGEVFEFVLQNARALNGVAEFHPWHAHGHSFWVVGRGEGTYDPEVDAANYNLENPLLRDTVTLWPLGWVALRFVASNPGVWLFHCHITSHLVMGMGFSMVVQPDEVGNPTDSVRFCTESDLELNEGEGGTTSPVNGTTPSSGVPTWIGGGGGAVTVMAMTLVAALV